MYTIKNINDFEESLKKLLVIRFVSSITVVVLFLIPFYFYLVDGKIVIDSVFIIKKISPYPWVGRQQFKKSYSTIWNE